jgi:hypothetical protein
MIHLVCLLPVLGNPLRYQILNLPARNQKHTTFEIMEFLPAAPCTYDDLILICGSRSGSVLLNKLGYNSSFDTHN